MRYLIALVFALLLVATPSLGFAQDTRFEAWAGYVKFGVPEEPVNRYVRVGNNHYQDMGLGLMASSKVWGPLAVYGRFLYSATSVYWWSCDPEAGCDDEQGPNPGRVSDSRESPLRVYDTSLGLRLYPTSFLSFGGGAGVMSITGSYYDYGSVPMHSGTLSSDVQLCAPINALRLCAEAGTVNVYPRIGRFTTFADRAYHGRENDPNEVHGEDWWNSWRAGMTIGVAF